MERERVEAWVRDYERLWRTPGTEGLAEIFTADATYRPSPWSVALRGLDSLGPFWEAERKGPGEEFKLTSAVVAVDGATAVVQVAVDYGEPLYSRWRDLWVLRFADDGRCASFEEWPFAPDQPDGH